VPLRPARRVSAFSTHIMGANSAISTRIAVLSRSLDPLPCLRWLRLIIPSARRTLKRGVTCSLERVRWPPDVRPAAHKGDTEAAADTFVGLHLNYDGPTSLTSLTRIMIAWVERGFGVTDNGAGFTQHALGPIAGQNPVNPPE
jgi:hypothetical protein